MKLIATLLLTLCLAAPAYSADTLSFGYGGDSISLVSIKVLSVAYSRLGVDIKGVRMPGARSITQSAAGHTDGEINRIAAVGEEHPSLLRVPVPIYSLQGIALTCGIRLKEATPQSIAQYRVGIKRGNRYAEQLAAALPNVTRLNEADQMVELLKAGRLDVVIVDNVYAESLLSRPGNEQLYINEPPLVTIPLYHYLHDKNAALVPKITRILQEMNNNGEIASIRASALSAMAER